MSAERGRWREAEATYREVLAAESQVLGEDHPSTLVTRQALTTVIAQQRRWPEAEAGCRVLLADQRRVLGEDHPSTLATRHMLANTMTNQGKWPAAEVAFRGVLEAEKRVLGENVPETRDSERQLKMASRRSAWVIAPGSIRTPDTGTWFFLLGGMTLLVSLVAVVPLHVWWSTYFWLAIALVVSSVALLLLSSNMRSSRRADVGALLSLLFNRAACGRRSPHDQTGSIRRSWTWSSGTRWPGAGWAARSTSRAGCS